LKLTVLGCYGSFPKVNGACSGYLLQSDETNILLDCGNGTISRLQRYLRIEELDAIVLSHLHFDHTADAFTLKYALETKMAKGQIIGRKKLLCPAGPLELAGELFDENVFDVVNIEQGREFRIGDIGLSFMKMKHLVESYAVIVKWKGRKLVYSGDTAFCENLVKAAENADLLLCESTALEADGDIRSDHHMSAGMAGRVAAKSNVGKLVLTHFWYETSKDRYLNEAKKYFDRVYTAKEFLTYEIGE